MSCKHHPEYDPASGEPTGTIQYAEEYTHQERVFKPFVDIPCPYCWQARAKWLKEQLDGQIKGSLSSIGIIVKEYKKKTDKRIAELEGQLSKHRVTHHKALKLLDGAEKRSQCRICHEQGECHCPEYVSNLEKREAVLEGQLAKEKRYRQYWKDSPDKAWAEMSITKDELRLAEKREAVLRKTLEEIAKMADSHTITLSGPGGFIAVYEKATHALEPRLLCGCVGICKGHDQSSI